MKTVQIRLLLADDHALVRTGMRAILSQQPGFTVVAEAADGHAILDAIATSAPDIVLLDISLPGINGLDIIPRIKKDHPSIEVIILSMHNAEEYILRAFQLGASGYLTKDAPPEELIAAVRQVGEHLMYYPKSITKEQLEALLDNAGERQASRLNLLTLREREVLQLMAEGLSTNAIALKMKVSPKTVETHRANLSAKLGIYDVASLTRFAIQCGLVSL